MAAKYKKRADGRYLIQIVTGYGANGKPRYKNIYAYTIRELEEKAAVARAEIEKGIIVNDEKLTLQKWAEHWLELYKSNAAYNTQKLYRLTLSAHIIPALRFMRLKDIKPHHAQELINKLYSEGKKRTAENVYQTLKQILNQAVKNEYIYKNAMDSVEIKKADAPMKRSLTDGEIEIVRSADLPLREKTFIILLLNTGLRRGEALVLMRGDIDMKSRSINVNKNLIFKMNSYEVKGSPKSEAGNRILPITDELYSYLQNYLPTLKGLCVFPTDDGDFMTETSSRRMWRGILRAMNIAAGGTEGRLKLVKIASDITPHIFRHTFATLLYRSGVDVKIAQYLLGHANLNMTMEIYTHLDNQKKEEAIGKFNTFMNSNIQSKISQSENN